MSEIEYEFSQRVIAKREIIINILSKGLDLNRVGVIWQSNDGDGACAGLYEDIVEYYLMPDSFDKGKAHRLILSGTALDYVLSMSNGDPLIVESLLSEIKIDMLNFNMSVEFKRIVLNMKLNVYIEPDDSLIDSEYNGYGPYNVLVRGVSKRKHFLDGERYKEEMRDLLNRYYRLLNTNRELKKETKAT